jgi:predicted DNA-binding protein with PD1-like motif
VKYYKRRIDMQYSKKGNILVVRLFPEEDVVESLKQALLKTGIKNAVILSGIGMLRDIELKVYTGKGKYKSKLFKKDYELVSFSGNIVRAEEGHILHIHTAIADHSYRCYAGHFGGGKVAVTLEAVIMDVPIKMVRRLEAGPKLTGLFIEDSK